MPPQRLFDIMSGKDRSLAGKAARVGLSCLEPFYRAAVGMRNFMFDAGLRKPKKLPRPVVSVGNITTGGTGKTPMVIEIARRLIRMGRQPAVLLRGYGAKAEADASDEAVLLRMSLAGGGSVAVVANPNRAQGAADALRQNAATDVFVLDDGFQHRQAARDADLVLIDATAPFGHGRTLPRGLLREGVGGLKRAAGIIVTRADQIAANELAALDQQIATLTGKPPIAHVAFRWSSLRDVDDAELHLVRLSDRRVLGVCGVGNPAAFEAMLKPHAAACEVLPLADHYAYTFESLSRILAKSRAGGFDCIVTTEKDWVKWRPLLDGIDDRPVIYRACLHTVFLDGCEALDGLLRGAISGESATPT